MAKLKVIQVENVDAALNLIEKGVIGTITDFSNRCTQFVKDHPHPYVNDSVTNYLPDDLMRVFSIPGHIKCYPQTAEQAKEF